MPNKRSAETRRRLLNATADLIAEIGWGRVTTRAIAEAADLPHGTVSYHFAGKHELLTAAAVDVVERMFPVGKLEAVQTLTELIPLVSSSIDAEWTDPVATKVLLEAMREAGRDQVLRERIAMLLREYRRVISDLLRAEQQRDAVAAAPTPLALATLLAAASDGLLLHSILDPELDVAGAAEALLALISTEVEGKAPG